MKVLVVAAAFSAEPTGVQRHAINLVRCLLTIPAIHSISLIVAPWQAQLAQTIDIASHQRFRVHVAKMPSSSFGRNLWYLRDLPKLAHLLEADLVHLTYPAPLHARAFPCPVAVTLHDLYPYEIPSNFGMPKAIINRLILQQCLRNAAAIACVSDSTYLALARHASQRIHRRALRIYNCVEPVAADIGTKSIRDLEAGKFLLCVAQHRANKNLLFLLGIFAGMLRQNRLAPTVQLVVVGITGPETSRLRTFITAHSLASRVRLLHGLSEAEMNWCYLNCSVVLAPSKIEGFGLPVVEGLLAGCNIVCSEIAAFREIGTANCHFVRLDGDAEDNFAKAIEKALKQPRRSRSAMPGLSAPVIAAQYHQLYTRLLRLTSTSVASAAPRVSNPYNAGRGSQ